MQWEKETFDSICAELPQNPILDGKEDSMVWNFDNSRIFSVRSFSLQAYKFLYGNSQVSSIINSSWIGRAPLRVEILAWFVLQGKLNTR